MADPISALAVGLIGSLVAGAAMTTAGLGIGCAFGKHSCAFKSDFGKETRGLSVVSSDAAGTNVSFPLVFQVNNTDLSHDDLARLAGLTANVLDVAGHAVFNSDYFDAGDGIIIGLGPDANSSTSPMPSGLARGEFSFTLPHAVKANTTVQGTWVGMSAEDADDKTKDAFDQVFEIATKFLDYVPVDVADRIGEFLASGADLASSVVEAYETDGDEGPDPFKKGEDFLEAGAEVAHSVLEAVGVHVGKDDGKPSLLKRLLGAVGLHVGKADAEPSLIKRHWYSCCHKCSWFICKLHWGSPTGSEPYKGDAYGW